MLKTKVIVIALAVLGAAGCAESERQQATGQGTVRAINAAVTSPGIVFHLEEDTIDDQLASYRAVTAPTRFDDLTYVANFDYRFAGDASFTRLASVAFDLIADRDYLFIFSGSLTNPSAAVWESPIRDWAGTETVIEVAFGHLSPQLGSVDVYFAAADTVPVIGQALATLSNGNRSDILEIAAGQYEMIITTAGDPADILFTSAETDYPQAAGYLLAMFDGDPSITSSIGVNIIGALGGTAELTDVNAPPTLRTFHAAFGTVAFDLYRDGDFSAPLIANTNFGEISAPADTLAASSIYSFTEAGNVGVVLFDSEFPTVNGRRNTRFLIGDPASLSALSVLDNLRSVEDSTRFRIIQASSSQSSVDIYLVEQGTDIADVVPGIQNIGSGVDTGYISTPLPANTYEVYVTTATTKDVLAGPAAFDAVDGDIVHFAIIDTADPNVLELVKYDHLSIAP